MFQLARTIPDFENYLSNGYLLHEKEAREKIAELKQLEMQQTKQSPPAIKKSNRNFYEVLGVRYAAEATEVEKAYPEKKRVVLAGSEEDQGLQEAYRVLANKDLRSKFDHYGYQGYGRNNFIVMVRAWMTYFAILVSGRVFGEEIIPISTLQR
ncbi:MAG: hypothetical protein IPK76_22020 [Lewinellaceae bacterium]|nr:hypothetical protein [Lewinellaceae bacterium]